MLAQNGLTDGVQTMEGAPRVLDDPVAARLDHDLRVRQLCDAIPPMRNRRSRRPGAANQHGDARCEPSVKDLD